MEAQAVVALVIGIVVVLFVPALVWSTVVAGLYRVVREKMRETVKRVARRVPVDAK
jgi:hypothetical protein